MTANTFDFSDRIARGIPPAPKAAPGGGRVAFDFTTAFPDPDSFPADGLLEALGRALKDEGKDLVYYPHPQGHPAMREFIAEKLEQERGMNVSPDQILLTTGSGQAVARYVELLTDPGDIILTEKFSYSGTMGIMRRHGARLVGVDVDEEGIIPSALDDILTSLRDRGQRAKFLYTIPTFQNPTGTDMSLGRRQDVLDVAQRHRLPIFEDDCYADLRFDGENSPAIQSLDQEGSVLYCGSFSKIVAPGMRLGFMAAPPSIIDAVKAIHLGATPSQFSALATLYYLQDHLDEHVQELREIFRSRKDTAVAAVGEYFGSRAECSDPDGGLYLWLKLPEGANTAAVLAKARERQIGYGPGTNFSPGQDAYNYLRLCYGHLTHDTIRQGVANLAAFLEEEGMLE